MPDSNFIRRGSVLVRELSVVGIFAGYDMRIGDYVGHRVVNRNERGGVAETGFKRPSFH